MNPIRDSTSSSFDPFHEELHTVQIQLTDDRFQQFREYILAKEPTLNKRQLLEDTILSKKVSVKTSITYKIEKMDAANFDALLKLTPAGGKSKVQYDKKWYDYSKKHSYWVGFVNDKVFGGAYRDHGFFQEERMFCEFPELAYLDYAIKGELHPCTSQNPFIPEEATPFIIEDVSRQWIIDDKLYGRALEQFQGTISDSEMVAPVEHTKPINIIGLAAIDWNRAFFLKRYKYQLEDLRYLLKAAFLGNLGAKKHSAGKKAIVHTAAWGCGAYKNSEKMISGIQILAAKMAGVDLVFHGIGNPANPGYDKDSIKAIQSMIEEAFKQGKTPLDILNLFLTHQMQDIAWAPRR